MKRIIVLNPKGGSGKTTIATNLAANFAVAGHHPALMDLDPQGSSMRWLKKRARDRAAVHGIAGFERSVTVTRNAVVVGSQDGKLYALDKGKGSVVWAHLSGRTGQVTSTPVVLADGHVVFASRSHRAEDQCYGSCVVPGSLHMLKSAAA